MVKPNVNYWTDVGIGAAFGVSAVSGLVFLLPAGGESAGGGVLGLSYRVWDQVHLWASLAMIAGVLVHLVLHTKWVVCMTQRILAKARRSPAADACPTPRTTPPIPRRRFLYLSGITLAAGTVLATCGTLTGVLTRVADAEGGSDDLASPDPKSDTDREVDLTAQPLGDDSSDPGETSLPEVSASDDLAAVEPTITPAPAEALPASDPTATPDAPVRTCLDCPRGVVNDPYPGRCRLYIDRDGDRLCDRSIPYVCG